MDKRIVANIKGFDTRSYSGVTFGRGWTLLTDLPSVELLEILEAISRAQDKE